MARDGWTHVATLLRADEAELLRGLLESAGIAALVEDAAVSALNPLWQSAVGGAKVLVPLAEAERAAAVISESGVFQGGASEPVEIPEEEWSSSPRATADAAAAPEATDGGERAATRAFRSAFAALALAETVVVPLYALSVAIRALRVPGARSARARRRAGWGMVVSALALAFGLVLWSTFISDLTRGDRHGAVGRLSRPPVTPPARP